MNYIGLFSDAAKRFTDKTAVVFERLSYRGFAMMGKYPISHMTDPMSFSPVDCTARAAVLLAGTNDCYLDRAINSIMTLDYFNIAGTDTEED